MTIPHVIFKIFRQFTSRSPLVEVLPKPVAIPKLKQCLSEELSNVWNEFVSNYDPLECTDLLKNTPGFFEIQAILLITLISTLKESRKGFRMIKPDLVSKIKYILSTFRNESRKRGINLWVWLKSIGVSLNPINLIRVSFFYGKNIVYGPLKLYSSLFKEIMALYSCLVNSYCQYNNTLVGTAYNYTPLFYNSLKEIIFYLNIIFQGPRTIIEDVLLQKESFQTITLCGRKSVAWSDSVKLDSVKKIASRTGCTEIEIVLSIISNCISKYLVQTKHLIPDYLPVTLRNINSNYIFATGLNIKPGDSISGILFLNLPIIDPEKDTSIVENLVEIKSNFRTSLNKQGLSHLLSFGQTKFGFLSKILPVSVLGVYFRYLSRKYAVSVTEVTSRYPNVTQKTLWGQEVTDGFYWNPPQANSSKSLC